MGNSLADRIENEIQKVCEVRITAKTLEALRLEVCGGKKEMLEALPYIKDGANFFGFIVRIDDSVDTPEGFKVVVLT